MGGGLFRQGGVQITPVKAERSREGSSTGQATVPSDFDRVLTSFAGLSLLAILGYAYSGDFAALCGTIASLGKGPL
jgi:hypothetical protein